MNLGVQWCLDHPYHAQRPNLTYFKMPWGMSWTEVEKEAILSLRQEAKSQSYIANRTGRSQTVVNSFLRNPEGYGTMKRSERNLCCTNANLGRLLREASETDRLVKETFGEIV